MVLKINGSLTVPNSRSSAARNTLRAGQLSPERQAKMQSVFNKCNESSLQHAKDLNKGYGEVRKKMLENMSPEEREKFLEREKNTSLDQRMETMKMQIETLSKLSEVLKPLDETTDTIAAEAPKMQE